ncbi:hypothetical protein NEOLEDRAFT_1081787, partial [Neolentinus lepideus HHB14362 ss-1]
MLTSTSALPKMVRDALMNLASPDDIREMQMHLDAALENVTEDTTQVDLEVGAEPDIDWSTWSEGVEDLKGKGEDELWSMLGLSSKRLPFFQEFTDPSGNIDPWTTEGTQWLKEETKLREPLRPRWHQLVGILRMLEHLFAGRAVLLMDGVGLGKTLQSLGVITCLVMYQEYHQRHKEYPGCFSDHPSGSIPALANIIVCPPNLQPQWTREIHHYLEPRSFDIIPVAGAIHTREPWDKGIWGKSVQPISRRIVLAGTQAVADDGKAMYEAADGRTGEPKAMVTFDRLAPQSVYGRNYLLVIFDEAHAARKINKLHVAMRALRDKSSGMLALTATPATTKPEGESAEITLPGISAKIPHSAYTDCMLRWMADFRKAYQRHVIRRTIDSLDSDGNRISGLKPYVDRSLALKMYPWEYESLKRQAHAISSEASGSANIHNASKDWLEMRSCKLDALAKIVTHHLATDNACVLKVGEDGYTLVPDETAPRDDPETRGSQPDRIVVYSAFPSSNFAIQDVFRLFNIDFVAISGKTALAKRAQELDKWRSSTPESGPRVLLLSNVGMDLLWSAQDDEQLRGRIYRYPQRKSIVIYRLLADNTPDMFLSTISFAKSQIHQAFIG